MLSKTITDQQLRSGLPVSERPLQHLFWYGSDNDHGAEIARLLRMLESLLRSMLTSIDEETGEFGLVDRDLDELICLAMDLVRQAKASTDLWEDHESEAQKELEKRVEQMQGTNESRAKEGKS